MGGDERHRGQVQPEPKNALALCAPRFPENVSGIASCSEMGSTHSCTLHSGQVPLALSCGELAVERAFCLELTNALELVPSAKVLSSASSGPHPFPDLNVPPPGSLHLCMPFAQLQVCFLAFVATLCYRSVPTVHYRVDPPFRDTT